jgi:hypothetical protein
LHPLLEKGMKFLIKYSIGMKLLIVVLLSEQVENVELYPEESHDMENEANLEWLLTRSLLTIYKKNRRFN